MHAIELDKLTRHYGPVRAVEQVSFHVAATMDALYLTLARRAS